MHWFYHLVTTARACRESTIHLVKWRPLYVEGVPKIRPIDVTIWSCIQRQGPSPTDVLRRSPAGVISTSPYGLICNSRRYSKFLLELQYNGPPLIWLSIIRTSLLFKLFPWHGEHSLTSTCKWLSIIQTFIFRTPPYFKQFFLSVEVFSLLILNK